MTITNPVRSAEIGPGVRTVMPIGALVGAPAGAQTGAPKVRIGLVRLRVRADDAELRALSHRELQVLTLVASGGTRDEISHELGMAPGTVANHMSRIYRALGARNAAHAVALAHGCGVIAARPQPPAPFVSRRERQVLAGLAHGLTSAQVATHLSLSSETVKTHLQRVYRKLDATCRANAVDSAICRRLLAVIVDTDSPTGAPAARRTGLVDAGRPGLVAASHSALNGAAA